MKKIIILAATFLSITTAMNAQNASNTAQQTVQLALSNALDISFTDNGSTNGSTVSMPFTSVNDYANGVESAAQEIRVRSNKNFNITVKSASPYFSVTNNGNTTTSSMYVASVLDLKVTSNQTGGNVSWWYNGYGNVYNWAISLINGGSNGGNQTFSVKYKATPGFTFPAGTYSVDVIYTATQQ